MKPEQQKNYDPRVEEKKIQQFWQRNNIYKFNPKGKEVYSIDTPPPTVSGQMHIGHAFSYTQGDFIARFQRMRGKAVFYPYGTDDNGLPTERLVEKLKNVKSTNMQRDEFVKLCVKTLGEIKQDFIQSWKDLAISCDFTGAYSTIDPHCVKTSQKSFIDLYHKGRVYQEETPISWCTHCQTAIAQAEFESIDMRSSFNDIIFKVGEKDIVIATTRPELLSACVAVIAHPSDKRYKSLFGKFAKVPLFDYEVPIIADEKADPEKGTGIVMCCTFGDKTDIEWWHKHNLPLKVVIEKNGKMNENAGKYKGLSLKDARKQIIEDLKKAGLLIAQKDIEHAVSVHERCGTELEFLKTKQWYVKILDKKQELIEAVDRITWYPEFMKVRYVHWVENLNWDWCISRQRHFGVPFPVWYNKKTGEIVVAEEDELPVDPAVSKPKHYDGNLDDLAPEKDIMDTWATSSLTPQIALNWAGTKDFYYDVSFEKMFPMSVRFQAHDIIRTWAFYTIVKGLYNNGDVPWKNIMIAGHALDPHGRKMSKSKGNVVDPLEVLKKYSADALRFWAAGSTLGDDLPYQEKDLVTGNKMIVKLWNASKFGIMHMKDFDLEKPELYITDKWILSKLHKIIKSATESFERYEYSKTKLETETFFWHTLCDNYLEISKARLYNPKDYGEDKRKSAQFALYHSILGVLKLMAPIMPHITEAIYRMYFAEKEKKASIHISSWPVHEKDMADAYAEEAGDLLVDIISIVRKYKSDKTMPLNAELSKLKLKCDIKHRKMINEFMLDLKATTKAKEIEFSGKADIKCANFDVYVGIE